MPQNYRAKGGRTTKRIPTLYLKGFNTLLRQIDNDPQPLRALQWLVSCMEMRGAEPGGAAPIHLIEGTAIESLNRLYTLSIVEGKACADGVSEIEMQGGKAPFTAEVVNRSERKIKAWLTVNDKLQGVWAIEPYGTLRTNRAAKDDGIFHIYAAGSADADAAGIEVGNPNNGVVSVRIQPEISPRPPISRDLSDEDYTYQNWAMGGAERTSFDQRRAGLPPRPPSNEREARYSRSRPPQQPRQRRSRGYRQEVGVGLEGRSDIRFKQAEDFPTDPEQEQTINIRLAGVEKRGVRPLTSASSTPVPPPIGSAE